VILRVIANLDKKDKSKYEKFGQYSSKHIRQVEQNLINVKKDKNVKPKIKN
jgi:hypothetical protein